MNYKKLYKDWYNKNPIRRYRKESGMTYDIVAARLGVAVHTIQRWEKGTRPTDENMEKLKYILGEDIEIQWEDWLKDKPIG